MSEKRISRNLFIALFIVMICLPWFFWILLREFADSTNYENRYMAEMPIFDISTYENYPVEYEAYLNDNLPFRNLLISLNNQINYSIFHVSTNDKVIIGKDDWLFLGDTNKIPTACWWGQELYTEEALQRITDNLTHIEKYLADRDIEFIVFLAPYKERIYPEMLPDYYGGVPEYHAACKVVKYLREHTDIRIVYPYEELLETKEQIKDIPLYYKTDTHWNNVGAYVGSVALLKELGISMPEIASDEIVISEQKNWSGDLASMINLKDSLRKSDSYYSVMGYNNHGVERIKWVENVEHIYRCTDADARKIYIVGDSYRNAMADYIGTQFNDSYIVHMGYYNNKSLEEESPDIFVLITIDQNLDTLAGFDIERK